MPKLTWNEAAKKRFEAGVSEVAVFIGAPSSSLTAEAWDGITKVDYNPDGGDANDQYANNIKWLSLRGVENVKGNVGAFMYPPALNKCMGLKQIKTGIEAYVGQQNKAPLSICYKTLVGNEEDGLDFSEKLHIIWNMTFSPVQKQASTLNNNPEAGELSWDFSTTPIDPQTEGYKPFSYFEIEKTDESEDLYNSICDKLYGTDGTAGESGSSTPGTTGTLLMPKEIIAMINAG